MWQIGKWLIEKNIELMLSLYNFVNQIIGMMTTLEMWLTICFLGGMITSLALLIIGAYFVLSGKIKCIIFGIEKGG